MAKLREFSITVENQPLYINAELVRAVTRAGADGGSIIHFDGAHKIMVNENVAEVVGKLNDQR